jgi:exopolyphosphatase / guanosine-5'-triphosphate,3'-diphosphate pyrophosphatase
LLPQSYEMIKDKENIAVIKAGSNSIRMLIAEKSDSCSYFRELYRKSAITRISEAFNAGTRETLKPLPVERSVRVLGEFFDIAKTFGAVNPFIVAAGVIRQALNRGDFVSLVSRRFGKDIRIISGEEEAYFTCKGVLSSLNRDSTPLRV